MYKTALALGTLLAGLGVMLGAFGAHGLKEVLQPEQLQTFETGVRYQMYHSVALLFTGVLYSYLPFKAVRLAAVCFFLGILLFSGSLYLLCFLKLTGTVGLSGIGVLTPIGGVFLIAGWLLLFLSTLKKK